MTMPQLLKIRKMSIDIFKNEKCKVTFGLEYSLRGVYCFESVRDSVIPSSFFL